jgi:hypothetical protein
MPRGISSAQTSTLAPDKPKPTAADLCQSAMSQAVLLKLLRTHSSIPYWCGIQIPLGSVAISEERLLNTILEVIEKEHQIIAPYGKGKDTPSISVTAVWAGSSKLESEPRSRILMNGIGDDGVATTLEIMNGRQWKDYFEVEYDIQNG